MTSSTILGDYLQADKTAYFNLPILSKHVRPVYSPKARANIRKVERTIAKKGVF